MTQVHASASTRARATAAVRAAIYARVSSGQQAERHIIDSQAEAPLARAAADGHEIRAELRFLDDGQSGASLIRPALERSRDLAAMAAIDVVYVHAPDRLARSYGPLCCTGRRCGRIEPCPCCGSCGADGRWCTEAGASPLIA